MEKKPTTKRYPPELKDGRCAWCSTCSEQDPARPDGDLAGGPPARRGRRVAAGLGEASRDRRRQAAGADQRGAGRAQAPAQGELRAAPGQRHLPGGSDFLRGGARPPSKEVVTFIDAHRDHMTGGRRWGVEPICETLQVAPSTYYDAKSRPPVGPRVRDAELGPALEALWKHNYSVYGRRKLTKAARRAGHDVGRDQVARLMRRQGIRGASRAKKRFTTKSDPTRPRARTSSTATSPPPSRRAVGVPTSPTARRGRASSTSPSSSTCSPDASSAGRRRVR